MPFYRVEWPYTNLQYVDYCSTSVYKKKNKKNTQHCRVVNEKLTSGIAVKQVSVSDADHVIAAQIYVQINPTVAALVVCGLPPEPKYGHFGVHDVHVGRAETTAAVLPLVLQQVHQPPEPFNATQPVPHVGGRCRGRAPGQQAEIRVAHVAAEAVHRRPDHVQAAVGRAALDQRGQPAPHGHLCIVNSLGLTAVDVHAPHGRRQLKNEERQPCRRVHCTLSYTCALFKQTTERKKWLNMIKLQIQVQEQLQKSNDLMICLVRVRFTKNKTKACSPKEH